ncbi:MULTISPECIES: baseplate J/gp47 family protein [unclassified Pseudomonas]|uniref:baseplate assembly protein n=1 Tax=unclassified Pseudomonas TaxID=196821 RepID=UPI0024499685|nr:MULTISPECIES: baseplate J/gp47 family protein [unclassified Pseudomonas]MDH0894347.1 baseplate J/gp47 family protein [Pseudomonas sp. GD03875]MDH1063358.1 baseplate J/gp47 family protein [Pseudomonas sp. GD03985]
MPALPEPVFIEADAAAITAEMIAAYERMTGRTLFPAQVERLLVDLAAYRETLVRIGINDAARQNLVAFARAPMLDYLGELVDTHRLPAQPSRTTIRLTFEAPLAQAMTVPAGWRVATGAGIQFATTAELVVAAGQSHAECAVVAVDAGPAGNGYLPGQITQAVDSLPVAATLQNLTTTAGGLDVESDERYRARIKLAPERFSWGSANRYRWLAMTTAPSLVDVQVFSPSPDGRVNVVLLDVAGAPAAEVVELVRAALTDRKNRMLGDRVTVLGAAPVDYNLRLVVDVLATRVPSLVLDQVKTRLQAWADSKGREIGADLVPAQIKTALGGIDGLYDVRLVEPAALRQLALHEYSRLQTLSVELGRVVTDA